MCPGSEAAAVRLGDTAPAISWYIYVLWVSKSAVVWSKRVYAVPTALPS